jgi:hypothetical protein
LKESSLEQKKGGKEKQGSLQSFQAAFLTVL